MTADELKAEVDALRAEFKAFKDYVMPVIDGHAPHVPANMPPPPPRLAELFPLPPADGVK